MRAPTLSWPERFRERFGHRAAGIAAALALELLLLLALLSLSQSVEPPLEPQLTEVDLTAQEYVEPETEQPEPEPERARQSQPIPQPTQAPTPTLQPAPALPVRIPLPTAPPAPEPEETPRPPRPGVRIGQVQGPPNTGSPSSGDTERVGTAPNGEPLYAARWYREPGEEFYGFFSAASPGWGLMACRTVPNFYVTDCIPLGQTPGSMLTRSMLAGSGQLRVRPPQLGGRVLVGSWVRIRIDYIVRRE
jgi:periplasmic protein TonB